jgi:uncharacterized protein YigE (DUF2233 family)
MKGKTMTMKRNLIAAALILSAQMAAALTAEELAATLSSEGYSYIAIRDGETQISVRAYKGGAVVSSVYDTASGALLVTNSETRAAPIFQNQGVRIRDVARDFVTVGADGAVTGIGRGPGTRPPENRAEGGPENRPVREPKPEPHHPSKGGEAGPPPPRG